MTKELSATIKHLDNISFNKYLSDLSNDKNADYSLWKCLKNLKRPIQQISPIKMPNQQWAKPDKQKANVFFGALIEHFSVNSQSNNLNLPEISAINDEPIPDKAVEEVIKLKKSAGFDLITAEALKQLSYKTILQLSNIFKASEFFKIRFCSMENNRYYYDCRTR